MATIQASQTYDLQLGCQLRPMPDDDESGDGGLMVAASSAFSGVKTGTCFKENVFKPNKEICDDLRGVKNRERYSGRLRDFRGAIDLPGTLNRQSKTFLSVALFLMVVTIFSGCGGESEVPSAKKHSYKGYVDVGNPVKRGDVKLFSFNGLTKGKLLASAQTDSNGFFNLECSAPHTGPVLLEVENGLFEDISTKAQLSVWDKAPLKAVVPNTQDLQKEIGITLISTMAANYLEKMKEKEVDSDANIASVYTRFSLHFFAKSSPAWVIEAQPLSNAVIGHMERDSLNHILHAGFSHLAREISLANGFQPGEFDMFSILAALSDDLEDLIFDGKKYEEVIFIDRASQIPLDASLIRNRLALAIHAYLRTDGATENRINMSIDAFFAPDGFIDNLALEEHSGLFNGPGIKVGKPGFIPVDNPGTTSNPSTSDSNPSTSDTNLQVNWDESLQINRFVHEIQNQEKLPHYVLRLSTKDVKEIRYAHGLTCPEVGQAQTVAISKDNAKDVFEIIISPNSSTVDWLSSEANNKMHCLQVWAIGLDGKIFASRKTEFELKLRVPPVEIKFNSKKNQATSGTQVAEAVLYNPNDYPIMVRTSLSGSATYRIQTATKTFGTEKIKYAVDGKEYLLANPFNDATSLDKLVPTNYDYGCRFMQPRYTQTCRSGQAAYLVEEKKLPNSSCMAATVQCVNRHVPHMPTPHPPRVDLFDEYASYESIHYRYWKEREQIGAHIHMDKDMFVEIAPKAYQLVVWEAPFHIANQFYKPEKCITSVWELKGGNPAALTRLDAQNGYFMLMRSCSQYAKVDLFLKNENQESPLKVETQFAGIRSEYAGEQRSEMTWSAREYVRR